MRFYVFSALVVLALGTVATGGVAASPSSPQPTAQNGTDAPTTATASTPAPTDTRTSAPSSSSATADPTATPGRTADDVLDAVDPRNATLADVQTVAEWLASEGTERSGRQAERAREWLKTATEDRRISLPNVSLGSSSTPTPTTVPTPVPAPESDRNATVIDGSTAVVASQYLPQKGIAKVTVHSDIIQTISFSDGGFLANGGGEGRSRSVVFRAGETATVAIPVTEVNGRAAVVIGTENTPLYGVIVKQGGGGLDVIRELSGLQGLVIGVVVAFVWMVIAGYNELRGERGRPEVA